MSVKERLKEYLKEKGIKIKHFEDAIGVSNSFVNNIRSSIAPEKLKVIKENFTDINIDWLLTGDGEMIAMEKISASGGNFGQLN